MRSILVAAGCGAKIADKRRGRLTAHAPINGPELRLTIVQ